MTSSQHQHKIPVTQIRPRFKIITGLAQKEIASRLIDGLRSPGSPCIGEAHERYASLKVPVSEQHYWSPQLTLTMEVDEEGTIIRGHYGPRPAVWTMFVFFYSLIAFTILIISIIGLTKLSLGDSVAILWAVPVLIFFFFSLYHVAYIGKKKGYDQIEILHEFFRNSTGLDYSTV